MDRMVGDALGGPDPAWQADPFHGSPLLEPGLFLTWSCGAQDGGVWASWLNLAPKARAGSVILGLWVGGPGQPSPESACFSSSVEQVRAASMLASASRNGSEASLHGTAVRLHQGHAREHGGRAWHLGGAERTLPLPGVRPAGRGPEMGVQTSQSDCVCLWRRQKGGSGHSEEADEPVNLKLFTRKEDAKLN